MQCVIPRYRSGTVKSCGRKCERTIHRFSWRNRSDSLETRRTQTYYQGNVGRPRDKMDMPLWRMEYVCVVERPRTRTKTKEKTAMIVNGYEIKPGANLRCADLMCADLGGANLGCANLNYSCWPLWCGSKGVILDDDQIDQLCLHL